MNRPVPIPQIEGVPAALTQAINNRLRTMQQSAGTTQTAQTNAIATTTTGSGTTSGHSGITTLRIAVTAATTVTPVAGADGRILVVIVTQGATGYAVTWASGHFKFAPPVPTTPNTESICVFAGNSADGLWHLAAAPILGRHI